VISADKLLADLTAEQRAAATHVDGPLLIIAGAGSGKTRVITRRVAHLISLGIPAHSILAITFTNKAAGEMKQRVSATLSRPLRDFGRLDQPWPTICTFHSLCLRILKHYAGQIGLAPNFSIYDSADQTRAMKEAIKSLDLSSTNFPPATVHSTISNAKNQLVDAAAFAQTSGDFYQRTVARIYTKYQKILNQNNALDFDDLLMRTCFAFREHPHILAELQERFQYLMIDEYQDTNHVQYVLAHALAMKHKNIAVVGDPDQSIYAWRGADIRNILEFERDYPSALVVRLEQNYRSTKTILRVASTLIANNTQRKDKTLWTENAQGDRARIFLCQDEYDEAETVTRLLQKLQQDQGIDWNRMAIFYRINALSRVMEDALRRAGVPYQIARGVEFYNRKEIKDVLAFLRVIANPADEISLDRIVNVPPRGLGDTSIKSMQAWGMANGVGLFDALKRAGEITGASARAVNSAAKFVSTIESLRRMHGPVRTVLEQTIARTGYEDLLKKLDPDKENEIPNVNELITSAAEYDAANPEGSLAGYLAQISLVSDVDHLNDTGGAVTLMTLHAAKGLEFPVVAMIGLEEGILPHSRARGDRDELEEERRLCFVGITRAQEHLIMSKAGYRTIRGLRERTVSSPFLNELPREAVEVIDHTGLDLDMTRDDEHRERARDQQQRLASEFRRGQLVKHPKFGIGRITEISDMGQHTRAVIEFNQAGRKTLILQYAQLEAVG